MKHCRHLLSPAQCLLRSLCLDAPQRSQSAILPARHFSNPSCARALPQLPQYSVWRPPDPLAEYTRDEQIDTSLVQVKQAEGSLGDPELLRSILGRLDRTQDTVIQLSKPGASEVAVVQVVKIQDLRIRAREKEKSERQRMLAQRDQKPKQIELNWAISGHDLELKLKQMEQFVIKGKKVELLLAAKRRARRASEEEGHMVVKKIRERLVEIDAKEVAPMDGEILKQAMMTVKRKTAK